MCGIFGYVGKENADKILLEGLRTLEYRGYDSAGIYIPGHGTIRAAGPIASLYEKVPKNISGTSGIAHTRWATHGAPTEMNAHPHHDGSEAIWVVHNGIIDNWREIKEGLQQQGVIFDSDTDSEVLAKLIGINFKGNLREALTTTLPMIRGTYGLAVMHEENPNEIYVARLGSPIILGIGSGGNLISSDSSALLAHTKEVIHLDDGDVALITPDSYEIMSMQNGKTATRIPERIEWDLELLQKNGYEHFMLKEIFEAPEVIENTIRGRLIPERGRVKLGGLESVLSQLTKLEKLNIVGCGSAYYAGSVGAYLLEEYGGIQSSAEISSEYRYRSHIHNDYTALLAVSQSGETADTIAAIRKAKENGQVTMGVVNVVGSTITRETIAGVHNHAGPEVAVASTKAFLSQLTVFVLLTLLTGRTRGMTEEDGETIIQELQQLPAIVAQMLENTKDIQAAAEWLATFDHALFLGRHAHAPIAREGALKLKEVSYLHAEAYPGGELKHGPIALLDKDFPVVALAPQDHVYEKMVSNLQEVQARSAPIISITTPDTPDISAISTHVITVPKVHPILQPIVSTVPLHLLAYYVGVARELNVDRPRNLAKSVTVE